MRDNLLWRRVDRPDSLQINWQENRNMRPEDYSEMKIFLNELGGWLWKKVLAEKSIKGVIHLLRDYCTVSLHYWSDEDLEEFFTENPLSNFDSVEDRI